MGPFRQAEPADDLIFMGAWTPRRGRVIAGAADKLAKLRGRYVFSDNSQPNTVASPGFLTGAEKWQALSRSRVLLNVHQGDEPYFEWHRALQAITAGRPYSPRRRAMPSRWSPAATSPPRT